MGSVNLDQSCLSVGDASYLAHTGSWEALAAPAPGQADHGPRRGGTLIALSIAKVRRAYPRSCSQPAAPAWSWRGPIWV